MASKFTRIVTLDAYWCLAILAGGAVADQPIHGVLFVVGLGLVVWPLAHAITRRAGGRSRPPYERDVPTASGIPPRDVTP